jgi:hypothetical protein
MKKLFLAALLVLAAGLGTAHAQNFSTSVNGKRHQHAERPPATLSQRPVAGAIPRGVRGGNPLQLLNPRAPHRYFGSLDDTVTYDQDNPSRITGIILFGFRW